MIRRTWSNYRDIRHKDMLPWTWDHFIQSTSRLADILLCKIVWMSSFWDTEERMCCPVWQQKWHTWEHWFLPPQMASCLTMIKLDWICAANICNTFPLVTKTIFWCLFRVQIEDSYHLYVFAFNCRSPHNMYICNTSNNKNKALLRYLIE